MASTTRSGEQVSRISDAGLMQESGDQCGCPVQTGQLTFITCLVARLADLFPGSRHVSEIGLSSADDARARLIDIEAFERDAAEAFLVISR